jgi:hypothetical protein
LREEIKKGRKYVEKENYNYNYNLCCLSNNIKAIKSNEDVIGCGRFKYIEILVCNSEL